MATAAAIIAGLSLAGTTIDQISNSINTGRNIVIEISNCSETYSLGNPRIHTVSGYCVNPPQPTISTLSKEACTFTKTADTACGAVGVLTYQIFNNKMHCVSELAIMFSVPYDYNLYENMFALGIFLPGILCNDDLFNRMYNDPFSTQRPFTRDKGTGSEITFSAGDLCVRGTMSPAGQSIMKVEFGDKLS
ncbi:deep-sea actinoporin Cjtox I-like [Brachyhypopomus gauderio]|uniref:deep-sea actinoporin Cjtox I-like n=1 Tax=Brachyhypopomus gauderio TaxID=698409 RepID=UPI004042B9BE